MMTHPPARHRARSLPFFFAVLLSFALPLAVMAHAELATSDPADGTTVEAPFAGPVVMTFTETLSDKSQAGLIDGAGKVASKTAVDGKTMTLTPATPLSEGDHEVRWTAVADDGHIERGTIRFTVAAAPTPEPTPEPTAERTPTLTPEPASDPTPGATASVESSAAPAGTAPAASGDTDTAPAAPSGGDVIVPIVVGALLVGAVAVFLLRRRDSTSTPS